ncbi:uncharacterized protein LOC106640974 [Copidosoma floridanum]|uniref:uncharacterized protein LOC106640974 n=1 Tax=Copidosoma floridanum TaxID=29053 RepID=UPI0006C9ADBD|nr:uncharacterized protein LOC106640974 [Copidosoma floridanum]
MKDNSKNHENNTMTTNSVESSFEQVFDDSRADRDSPNFSRIESVAETGAYCTRDQCVKILKRCKKFLRDAHVYEKLESFFKYLLDNPALLIGFTIVTAIFIIPVLLFTAFAIINVAVAFTGFMIIEVVLLLIGLTVLCCILFFIISGIMVTAVSFIISAFITYSSFILVKNKIRPQR